MSNPLFIGKVLHDFEKLPSTNGYALELLAKSKPPEGTVISTYNQTMGRGQIGSNWESEPGRNISLSIILYPHFLKISDQSLLNQAIAIACRRFLADLTAKKVEVKWPNDLLVQSKKIGGILIQNSLVGQQLQSSVVGIGININQRAFNQAPNPTSLALLNGKFYELDELRLALLGHLEKVYLKLRMGDYQAIQQEYLLHLFRLEEESLFARSNEELFQGTIVGISSTGKLQVKSASGIEEFGIKEIQFKL